MAIIRTPEMITKTPSRPLYLKISKQRNAQVSARHWLLPACTQASTWQVLKMGLSTSLPLGL